MANLELEEAVHQALIQPHGIERLRLVLNLMDL